MKKLRILGVLLSMTLELSTGSTAFAASLTQDEPLVQGPPPSDITGPYDQVLQCLNEHLTPEQKLVSYGVWYFPDATGKTNIAATDASGTFLPQDYSAALETALGKIGVQRADASRQFREMFDWAIGKRAFNAQQAKEVGLMTPDVMISGSFGSLDITPGKEWEITGPVNGGRRGNRIILGFDAKATAMPFNKMGAEPGSEVSNFGYTKQLVGYEDKAGMTWFFGGVVQSIIGFDLDKEVREPLQYTARAMTSIIAYRVVRDVTRQTACDPVLQAAEMGASIQTLVRHK